MIMIMMKSKTNRIVLLEVTMKQILLIRGTNTFNMGNVYLAGILAWNSNGVLSAVKTQGVLTNQRSISRIAIYIVLIGIQRMIIQLL